MMTHPEIILTAQWSAALAHIVDTLCSRVMVIGGVDVGKTSFIHALLKAWMRAGRRPLVLDADPGQKMLGPPGAVTLGAAHPGDVLSLEGLAFVGTTSAAAIAPLAEAAGRLAECPEDHPLVVNTSGLIRGPGVPLKLAKIRQVKPDLLIMIGSPSELGPIEALADVPTLHVDRSPAARRKTRAQRAANRRAAFSAYLASAQTMELPLSGLRLGNSQLVCLADSAARPVCAISDAQGVDLALGILDGFHEATATVVLPPLEHRIAGLRLGEMWARRTAVGWQLLDELLPASRVSGAQAPRNFASAAR